MSGVCVEEETNTFSQKPKNQYEDFKQQQDGGQKLRRGRNGMRWFWGGGGPCPNTLDLSLGELS